MSANPHSVSVHIRRGDYVSDFRSSEGLLICTPDYYKETMSLMKTRLGEGVVFYVFSDDPDWCRTGLDYPSDFKIVSNGQRSASHEIVMMSSCRNAVMANSSFSWWGAWLNENPKKIVIYPENGSITKAHRILLCQIGLPGSTAPRTTGNISIFLSRKAFTSRKLSLN